MAPPPPREPRMARWTRVWYCLGGGLAQRYNEEFFNWWARVTFYIDEYYYAGMDFCGDPDLPLPVDAKWGDIGMISFLFISFVFYFLHIYNVFGCANISNMCVLFWSRCWTYAPRRETQTHAESQSPRCWRV
jgi:hypothetical protein